MIKQIRQELGLSQGELGNKLGKTQGAISHYETGRQLIDSSFASDLIELCEAHGVYADYNLIYGYVPNKAVNG